MLKFARIGSLRMAIKQFQLLFKAALVVIATIVTSSCQSDTEADLAIINSKLYVGPNKPVIENATIIIKNGKISEIEAGVRPENIDVIDAGGRVVTSGLWNSHIHLLNPELATNPEPILREMLLKYGFTSVVDTGSEISITKPLSEKINNGEILGPRIIIAGGSIVPRDGVPFYLSELELPQVNIPEAAFPTVKAFFDQGVDGIKIYSGSVQPGDTILMKPEIIKSISLATHQLGGFVISHPHDLNGLINAVENGVDILAHTAPIAGPFGGELLDLMLENKTALIPTLALWSWELKRFDVPAEEITRQEDMSVLQLNEYAKAGGEILFGTDIGYMTDYNTAKEYVLMQKAELSFDQVLTSLTTDPSKRFSDNSGLVEVGAIADLVIYASDPTKNFSSFADIAYTLKDGKVIYGK